jgi:hypothetical protein
VLSATHTSIRVQRLPTHFLDPRRVSLDQVTSDGVPVLWHDDDIVTVDGAGTASARPVQCVTVAEFKQLTSGAPVPFRGDTLQLARVFKGKGQATHLQVHQHPPPRSLTENGRDSWVFQHLRNRACTASCVGSVCLRPLPPSVHRNRSSCVCV